MNRPSSLSNNDLEHLNALVDGELSAAESAHWENRISTESIVQDEYNKIVEVKAKLALISNTVGGDAPMSANKRNKNLFPRLSIAASIVLALATAGIWFELSKSSDQPRGLVARHQQFSDQQYIVTGKSETQFVSLGAHGDVPVPDLEPSKLFLVDTKVIEGPQGGAIMHYRGLSGCRLTIWAGPTVVDLQIEQSATQRFWTSNNRQFAMIATGMDEVRFHSIVEYVQTLSKLSVPDTQQQRLAMADVYKRSESCA